MTTLWARRTYVKVGAKAVVPDSAKDYHTTLANDDSKIFR
jgi:hypothetical protein